MEMRAVFALLAAVSALGAYSTADSSKTFIVEAIKEDNAAILLGELAARQAADPNIRAFGTDLAAEHTKRRLEATIVALHLKVSIPRNPTAEAAGEYRKLSKLPGMAFGDEFIAYMLSAQHKELERFQQAAQNRNRPEACEFAQDALETLQQELDRTETLKATTVAVASATK